MKQVLVVEDSPMVMKVIKHVLSQSLYIKPIYATSFAEAQSCVEQSEEPFFAALVDLNLPDAPNGEVVDYTLGSGISTIVLTGSFDEKRREELLAKGIVDYVTKEGRFSYVYALNIIHRLIKNSEIKVLVVDDSAVQRRIISQLLDLHLYQVLEADDGVEAIRVILAHPDIKLLITDYNMPRMDGFELVKNIRVKYEKSDLVTIGISSDEGGALSAKFIKFGANDFLKKPFNHEEFFCRINHNIEMIELIEKIRDSANRDDLTGIYHRQYFFRHGNTLYEKAKEDGTQLSAAMIDLDDFGKVNEQYGNDFGDKLMLAVAEKLQQAFDRFFLARADGQEYYVLLQGLSNEKATEYVEQVRQILSGCKFNIEGSELSITFAAGVSNMLDDNIDDLIGHAYACLRRAKDAGGDLVFGDD